MLGSLYELFRACTVRMSISPQAHATGFFVARGLVLTCAHVLPPNTLTHASPITVTWNHQVYLASLEQKCDSPYPDVALLRVAGPEHPCVLLDEDINLFDHLYCYGYPDDYPTGDSATFEFEGPTDESHPLLKLKRGQVRPGFSGAPLLNIRTGHVCGMMKRTRSRETDLGGRAIPTATILQTFEQVREAQQQMQQENLDWKPRRSKALEVFYSYAHQDEKLRDKLATHLSLLRRQGILSSWYDRDIMEGDVLAEEIKEHLNTAQLILLLISPDFMASDYCYDVEMQRAMERHERGDARVIPVILRPAEWHQAPFGKLKALPRDGRPVTSWRDTDEALLDVAQGIRRVVEDVTKSIQR